MLAEDIGTALGVPATLAALRRTQAGEFGIEQCHTLPEILAAAESGALESNGWMLPIETVFAPLPQLHVDNAVKKHLLNGCPTSHYPAEDGRYRVYGPGRSVFRAGGHHRRRTECRKTILRKGLNAHANLPHLDPGPRPAGQCRCAGVF